MKRNRVWLAIGLVIWLASLQSGWSSYNPVTGRWLNRDPKENLNEANLHGFNRSDSINRVDPDGRQSMGIYLDKNGNWASPHGLPKPSNWPPPTPPYTTGKDDKGQNYVKINKCNIVIFYGHGFDDYDADGNPVDFSNLTINQLNQSSVPALVKNDPCSAAGVLGCNSGNYVKIQNPIPDAPEPTSSYQILGNGALITQAWNAAIAQAKSICKEPKQCCKKVRVRFECPKLSWWFRPAGWCGKEEIIKCQ